MPADTRDQYSVLSDYGISVMSEAAAKDRGGSVRFMQQEATHIKEQTKRSKLPTILLIGVFLVGVSLLLYPTVSDYWNSLHQTKAITAYAEEVAAISEEEQEELLSAAREYNRNLIQDRTRWKLSEEELAEYNSLLNMSSDGIMGYINIPKISVTLPIYHTTDDQVLQKGAGHLEGSSLPVGGESTHCVLSSHRGLVSARLFTDLDQLKKGDTFTLTVLNQVLTYEIDQILIVLPDEMEALAIEEGEDYCTLVTCTPYGVNTHRLLVRGHRVETEDTTKITVTGDAFVLESSVIAPLVAVPVLLLLLLVLMVSTRRRKR